MASSYEAALAQVVEQHRLIAEQHAKWIADANSSMVGALRADNRRLEEELRLLKAFVGSEYQKAQAPPLPRLPEEWVKDSVIVGNGLLGPTDGQAEQRAAHVASQPRDATPQCASQSLVAQLSLIGSGGCGPTELPGMMPLVPPNPIEGTGGSHAEQRLSRNSNIDTKDPADELQRSIDEKVQARETRHLRFMFSLRAHTDEVSKKKLQEVLAKRVQLWQVTSERLETLLDEMYTIHNAVSGDRTFARKPGGTVNIKVLVDFMHRPDLRSAVSLDFDTDVAEMIGALGNSTMEELIDEATKDKIVSITTKEAKADMKDWIESLLQVIVVLTVIVNVGAMGASIDNSPDHIGWFVVEAVACLVFSIEVCFKLNRYKLEYVIGPAGGWNCMDMFITLVSYFEVGVSLYSMLNVDLALAAGGQAQSKISGTTRIVVMLRILRITRLLRLMKLVRSPLMRDLANMLVGFIIGLPSLLWVLIIFLAVLYMQGLIFRMMFGPVPGQDLMFRDGCGYPDDRVNFDNTTCPVHYLYGEEFFGTVPGSMFTAFRFMLGDYSTRSGKSIVVALSHGYGMVFDFVFVTWMIIVIFGLFNIITAIFVDSTTAGLKHNEIKRKHMRQYETRFVRAKLKDLLLRMQALVKKPEDPAYPTPRRRKSSFGTTEKFELEQEDFIEIMHDGRVKEILQELDVDASMPSAMFDTFDHAGIGKVTMVDIVNSVVKLRGQPHKNDMVACWTAIRALQGQFDKFALVLMPIIANGQGIRSDASGDPPSVVHSERPGRSPPFASNLAAAVSELAAKTPEQPPGTWS